MQKIINGILVESAAIKNKKIHPCTGCEFFKKTGAKRDCSTTDPSCVLEPSFIIWKRVAEDNTPKLHAEYLANKYKREEYPLEILLKGVSHGSTPSHLLNRHFVDNLWRWKCGLPEEEEKPFEPIDIDKMAKEQMSSRFIELMTNRMVLGTLRYGRWQDNKKNGIKYDRVGSIRKRLQLFEETGNSEYLVDIANFAMIEFEISDHPNLHFSPKDDDGEHVQRVNAEFMEKMNNTRILGGNERAGLRFIKTDPSPRDNNSLKTRGKIAYKFPMSTRVMTVDGEMWAWRIVNGKAKWLLLGSAAIEKS